MFGSVYHLRAAFTLLPNILNLLQFYCTFVSMLLIFELFCAVLTD